MKLSHFSTALALGVLTSLIGLGFAVTTHAADHAGDHLPASSSDHGVEAKPAAAPAAPAASPAATPKPAVWEPPPSYESKIYEMDSHPRRLLFTNSHKSEKTEKGFFFTNTYKDLDGNIVAVETTDVIRDGEQLRVHTYKVDQHQTHAMGKVEVKDGTAYFEYTKDGKTRTATESVSDDFVCGPTLLSYLHHRYDTIQNGGTVKARFIVWDRLESVGFQYFQEKELDYNGKKARMIKMKPSSWVVAQIVDPLHFIVPVDGSRVWEVDGRTQLKLKDGDKLKDLDADTTYEYPDEK